MKINAKFPKPATVKGAVLADLLSGRTPTHYDCWYEHSSNRLAHHIYMLRALGWPVETKLIVTDTADGRQAEIARYALPASVIENAGEASKRFVAEVAAAKEGRQ